MLTNNRTAPIQQLSNGSTFKMIYVKGGAFMMGSEEGGSLSWEKPIHTVTVNSFWIGEYPVTQFLWEAVMGAGSNSSYFKGRNRPVEQVSWYDAAVFCNALNERCGYEPCYFSDEAFRHPYGKAKEGYTLPNKGPVHQKSQITNHKSKIPPGYRLPTEAEWEYAARGGEQIRMDAARGGPNPDQRPRYEYAGGDKLDEVGWYRDNSHRETKPVGLKLPNELGIYDMSGNVWEWCEDQWHENYEGAPDDGSAWVGQEQGSYRVSRGGSWSDLAGSCRCASRHLLANRVPHQRSRLSPRVGFPFSSPCEIKRSFSGAKFHRVNKARLGPSKYFTGQSCRSSHPVSERRDGAQWSKASRSEAGEVGGRSGAGTMLWSNDIIPAKV